MEIPGWSINRRGVPLWSPIRWKPEIGNRRTKNGVREIDSKYWKTKPWYSGLYFFLLQRMNEGKGKLAIHFPSFFFLTVCLNLRTAKFISIVVSDSLKDRSSSNISTMISPLFCRRLFLFLSSVIVDNSLMLRDSCLIIAKVSNRESCLNGFLSFKYGCKHI